MSRSKTLEERKPKHNRLSDDDPPAPVLEEQARHEYEREYWRNPRVRRCPGCEDAVMDETDPVAQCAVHGEPYEEPFEFELRFEELFGHSPWENPQATKMPR